MGVRAKTRHLLDGDAGFQNAQARPAVSFRDVEAEQVVGFQKREDVFGVFVVLVDFRGARGDAAAAQFIHRIGQHPLGRSELERA